MLYGCESIVSWCAGCSVQHCFADVAFAENNLVVYNQNYRDHNIVVGACACWWKAFGRTSAWTFLLLNDDVLQWTLKDPGLDGQNTQEKQQWRVVREAFLYPSARFGLLANPVNAREKTTQSVGPLWIVCKVNAQWYSMNGSTMPWGRLPKGE